MKKLKFENKIALLLLIIGGVWIVFSDRLLHFFIDDGNTLTSIQTFKGWFYVIVTTFVFYIILKKHMLKLREAEQKLNLNNQKLVMAKEVAEISDERHKLVVSATNLGIWDWDISSSTIYFNQVWKAQVGYKEHELENKLSTWQNLLHPDEYDDVNKKLYGYLDNPEGQCVIEYRLRHKNGSYIWIKAKAEALKNKHGEVVRLFGSHTDISVRKELEMILQKKNEEIDQLINALHKKQ